MPRREYYQAHLEEQREYSSSYRKKNEERLRAYWRKASASYRSRNAVKTSARAVRQTRGIPREVCEVANCEIIGEAHHDDYSQPLQIRWLCKLHHEEHHHNPNKEQ